LVCVRLAHCDATQETVSCCGAGPTGRKDGELYTGYSGNICSLDAFMSRGLGVLYSLARHEASMQRRAVLEDFATVVNDVDHP
jgi:hypothetical protein